MKPTDHEFNTTYTDLSRDAVKDASDISKPWDAERADKENPTKNNALKHGCYSKDIVLPWENADEFNDQFQQYRDEFNPQGAFEESIVAEIAELQWLKRRQRHHYFMSASCDPLAQELEHAARQGADGIEAYLRDYMAGSRDHLKRSKKQYFSSREISARTKKLSADEEVKKATKEWVVAQGHDSSNNYTAAPEEEQRRTSEHVKCAIRNATERLEQQELTEQLATGSISPIVDRLVEQSEMIRASQIILERVYRPDDMDSYLKRSGSLDAKIQKAMARLVHAKEFQLRYGKKTVVAEAKTEGGN